MSEAPALEGALIRKIDDLLKTALGQASLILSGAGASTEEMLRATQAFVPLMCLLRDSLKAGGTLARGVGADCDGAARADGSRLVRKLPDDAHPPCAEGTRPEPAGPGGPALSPEEIERRFVEGSNVIPIRRTT